MRVTALARALGQAFDARAQHVDAAGGMEVQVAHTLAPENARGAPDGGRDVVELDVGEHVEIERAHARDRFGPGGRIQLQTYFRHAEPGRDLLGDLLRLVEVGNIERDREAAPDVHVIRRLIRHSPNLR